MDGVTDAPMRYMVAKYSQPKENPKSEIRNSNESGVGVMFTEFVSVDAIHYAKGKSSWEKVVRPFRFDELERPIVAQLFGKEPELFAEATELVMKMGFDGVDINMGCPARKVAENGAGAGLIRTPELAQEIIRAVQAGVGLRGDSPKLPVSVKTRIGVESGSEMEEWIEAIMEAKPSVISLHGRTLKQLYSGKADWEMIARAAEIVHEKGGIILGNGDVESIESAKIKIQKYGVDGVLIGRAAEGNPGVFGGNDMPSKEQRLTWMVEHAKIYEKVFGESDFLPMRKHLAWYAKGFEGASELRQKLVQTNSAGEVEAIITPFFLTEN